MAFMNVGQLRTATQNLKDDDDVIVWVAEDEDTFGIVAIKRGRLLPTRQSTAPQTPALHLYVDTSSEF